MGVIEDTMNRFPEHKKMIAVTGESQVIGEFLDWMGPQGYVVCQYEEDARGFYPVGKSIQELLAERYDVDLKKIEAEKRQMLKELRGE